MTPVDANGAPDGAGRELGAVGSRAMTAPMSDLVAAPDLVARLRGRTVTMCVLPREDGDSVVDIVDTVTDELGTAGLVHDVAVVHAGLTPATVRRVLRSGGRVVDARDIRMDAGPPLGRGDLVWRSLHATSGDLGVWIDSDFENFSPHVVVGLLAPLVLDPEVVLVRGSSYSGHRNATRSVPAVERSVLGRLDPSFVHVRDAVGGEFSARTDALRTLALEPDDGIEIGLLADVAEQFGTRAIREVDIGLRLHATRTPAERGRQARQTMRAALTRLGGPTGRGSLPLRPPVGPSATQLARPDHGSDG